MGTSIVRETRRARKEHCCNICMGPIRRGLHYDYEVVMTRSGSKRNKTRFHVWRTHTEAPMCDEQVLEYEREQMEQPVAQVVVFKAENRVMLMIGLRGETIAETHTIFVPTVINETELETSSSSDDEEDIPF